MNAKGEWNGSKLPRLLVERGEKIETEKDDPYRRIWKEDSKNQWEMKNPQKRKAEERVSDVSDTSEHSDVTEVTKTIHIVTKEDPKETVCLSDLLYLKKAFGFLMLRTHFSDTATL